MDNRKIAVIGTGMVGMSYAYTLLNQNACDSLVLCDIDQKRAEGEAMDLNHGLAFSGSHMKISSGDYAACRDADIAVSVPASHKSPARRGPLCYNGMRKSSVPLSIRLSTPGFTGSY